MTCHAPRCHGGSGGPHDEARLLQGSTSTDEAPKVRAYTPIPYCASFVALTHPYGTGTVL